jgi:hypothetical protein
LIDTTNFTFTPPTTGTYLLEAQPVIFTQFPLSFGPAKIVSVPGIMMSQPVVTDGQILLNFTVSGLTNQTFHLLQASPLNSAWTTNTLATLTTNSASSYRFTTTTGTAPRFYRVKTP